MENDSRNINTPLWAALSRGSRPTVRLLPALLLAVLLLTGCYSKPKVIPTSELPPTADSVVVGETIDSAELKRKQDSLDFVAQHHYSENFNFVVRAESLQLIRQQPEEYLSMMPTDTFAVRRHDHLVVADIRILPADETDSVWVQVARDQFTFGWTHEAELLRAVDPDDPISQFISTFSNVHLIIFLVVISLIAFAYLLRRVRRQNARIVHFNDIDSVYPTLLALTVAAAASLYASIQMFAPHMWQHFYFHPTLNPFSVPPLLTVFLVSVWAMLILAIACIDVVRTHLPLADAVLYLSGLVGVCAVNYIVFSLSTLLYIGYGLLAVYFYFAIRAYRRASHCNLLCGNCGRPIHGKGRCPHCGAVNE